MPSAKVTRAIRAFEEAVTAKALMYTTSRHEERAEGYSQRVIIEHNYVKARSALERLLENV